MFHLYTKNLKTSLIRAKKNEIEQSGAFSRRVYNFKGSVKDLFSREKGRKDQTKDALIALLPVQNTSAYHPPDVVKIALMDAVVFEALYDLYKALHDPSILDARRHQRYHLSPPSSLVIAETPITDVTLAADVGVPRYRRSLLIREITASDILATSSSTFPAPPAPGTAGDSPALQTPPAPSATNLIDGPRVMNAMDLKVIRFLGEGTSGKVYYVKDRISKTKVALKVIPKAGKNEYTLSILLQERDIAEKLSDSPWFVSLWAAWHDQANLYIAMTAYPTDLDSEMLRCGIIESSRARFYMAEIIIALTELHSHGIIHRDIKAPNILIDREGHIVLADFGLSKDFHETPTIAERVYQPYWPYFRSDNATSAMEPRDPEELYFVAWDYRGSELEMAPEIHLRQPYSFGVDFWSSAVVLYWMLTGRPPFYEDEDEYEDGGEDVKPLALKIAEDPLRWEPSDGVDDETRDFLEKMLKKDPKKRLMISYEMLNHPYFYGVNWTLMEERKVPPPWVPEFEVCHVYEPTSPVFTLGEPFSELEPDPCPEFTYLSQQAAVSVLADRGYDSDEDSDDGSITMTDIEIMELGSYENFNVLRASSDTPQHTNQSQNHDTCTLHSDSINEYTHFKESWDLTIVNQPPTQPRGPGPKLWLCAQDLQKLGPVFTDLEVIPDKSCSVSPTPTPAFSLAFESPACTLLRHRLEPYTHRPSNPQHTTHIVNGTGVMFKVRMWISKLWKPKSKKPMPLKRQSLLS